MLVFAERGRERGGSWASVKATTTYGRPLHALVPVRTQKWLRRQVGRRPRGTARRWRRSPGCWETRRPPRRTDAPPHHAALAPGTQGSSKQDRHSSGEGQGSFDLCKSCLEVARCSMGGVVERTWQRRRTFWEAVGSALMMGLFSMRAASDAYLHTPHRASKVLRGISGSSRVKTAEQGIAGAFC